MLVQKSSLDVAVTAVNMAYLQAQMDVPQYWQYCGQEIQSSTKQNIYPFISKFPAFREWVGDRTVQNVVTRDYTLVNKKYEFSFSLDVDAVNDDQYGIFNSSLLDAARARRELDDVLAFTALENGGTVNCWDGQPFYSASHPVNVDSSGAGTWSNLLIGASYDWTTVTPASVFALARAAMMKFPRDDGKRIGVVPDTIICGPDMEAFALKAIEAQFIAEVVKNGATPVGGAGVTNVYQGKATVIVTPWVQSSTRMHLLCTRRGLKPIIKQMREDRGMVPRTDPSLSNVFERNELEWGQIVRQVFGYGLPQFAVVVGGS